MNRTWTTIVSASLTAGAVIAAMHVYAEWQRSFGDRAAPHGAQVVRVDLREIRASLQDRRNWLIERARGPAADIFARDYEWILARGTLGRDEATQLAYVFFYSSGSSCGYFDDPVPSGEGVLKYGFHPGLGLGEGFPVYVDTKTGLVWQEGQTEKVDALALIRLFAETRAKAGNPLRHEAAK